ncbi:unnamed protein product [Rotaria sp. Silwood2]|nr:unnamed protein product [Rotaria sp. Silwood2]
MLFKIVFIFGCFVLTTNARCNLTAEPLELIECLSFTSTIVLGLVKNDIQRVCKSASLIATCASGHLSDCIGQQIGQAAFKEIINLSINCCPDRNSPSCSIRDSVMQEQRCFSADSLVTLSDGKQKSIVDLQSGDSLLAYNDKTKKVLSTHLLTMLDFQPHQFVFFKQVITTTGRQLSLSSSHLVPTDKHGYVMAKNIRIGMNVYVMNDNGVLITETVSNVSDVVKQGYIAPLTEEGTLIVNNVAASCYATINSHHAAHAVLAPMRWWYSLFGMSHKSNEAIGIHWFPKILYEITSFLIPSIIHR